MGTTLSELVSSPHIEIPPVIPQVIPPVIENSPHETQDFEFGNSLKSLAESIENTNDEIKEKEKNCSNSEENQKMYQERIEKQKKKQGECENEINAMRSKIQILDSKNQKLVLKMNNLEEKKECERKRLRGFEEDIEKKKQKKEEFTSSFLVKFEELKVQQEKAIQRVNYGALLIKKFEQFNN